MWEIAAMLGGQMLNSAGSLYGAKKQRDWERDMSNTAHQREVNDLIAAGLNPILSATGGRGASTPQVEAVNPAEGIGDTMQTIARLRQVDIPRIQNESTMVEANSAVAAAQRRNIDADTINKLQTADRNDLVVQKLLKDIENVEQSTRTSSAQEAATRETAEKTKQEVTVLKAIVPFIKDGTQAIAQIRDYLAGGGKLGDAAADLVEAVNKNGPPSLHLQGAQLLRFILDVVTKHAPQLLKGFRGDSSAATSGERGP